MWWELGEDGYFSSLFPSPSPPYLMHYVVRFVFTTISPVTGRSSIGGATEGRAKLRPYKGNALYTPPLW